jgi:Carboxypeptidase regulatory-like domain
VSADSPTTPPAALPARPGGLEPPVHSTRLELVQPIPPEVPVGARVFVHVRVSGAARDLRGGRIEVIAAGQVVATAELTEFRDDFSETDAFAVKAPAHVGVFTWTLRFPPQSIGELAYPEYTLRVSSQTVPHRTSLAVWAVPSPVRVAQRFAITVGAKSSDACPLGGAKVEIHDETGATIGKGVLGDTPLPRTDALYWTEIALDAPARDGMRCWSATFAAGDLELPHLGSSAEFSFTVVKPPEHRVSVRIIDADAIPVEGAQVALGPYRAATDEVGLAVIEVPAGKYDLAVWKSGFEAASKRVEVAANLSLQFELTQRPKEVTVWD